MLAAAVGVDRAVERNVRRLVAGDDRARALERHFGLQRLADLVALPAIVNVSRAQRFEASAGIGGGAAAATQFGWDEAVGEVGAKAVCDVAALDVVEHSGSYGEHGGLQNKSGTYT